ncbi:metallophosphoesterase family protein [Halobacillus amylolyticus]|uniref:Metallophosphatase family protein n=1 Tax=Halobacillus amylolyticus TaxID=2932259 RepID=A0ABY4HFU4_9BACI|nr:metallophosphoesterase family protein [Halobacillus amylolyticus]UOR13781.1 metallophosphatase family protein [Halobacillus amylolyticus]
MRLAFISDIHGNAHALEAVLKDIETRNIDKLFVLGDISYRGLDPQRSVDMVRELDAEVIKGNADEWLVRGVRQGEVPDKVIEGMNLERDWAFSKMTSDAINYLKELPEEINAEYYGVKIHGFHAAPTDLFEVVLPSEPDKLIKERLMTNEAAHIYVYGHIHKPYIRHIDGKVIINTGSVGLPFDGLAKPSYVIVAIEEDGIESSIIRPSFDLRELIEEVKTSDYPNKELLGKLLINASI